MSGPPQNLDELIEELAINYEHRECPDECSAGYVYRSARAAIEEYAQSEYYKGYDHALRENGFIVHEPKRRKKK